MSVCRMFFSADSLSRTDPATCLEPTGHFAAVLQIIHHVSEHILQPEPVTEISLNSLKAATSRPYLVVIEIIATFRIRERRQRRARRAR